MFLVFKKWVQKIQLWVIMTCSRVYCNIEQRYLLLFLGCDYGELVGNGHCNDEANNADCLYDGGDCCGGCVNTDQCSHCLCYDGGTAGADTSCKCLILIA